MDKSKRYIRMCRLSSPIQALRNLEEKWKNGDRFVCCGNEGDVYFWDENDCDIMPDTIFLPTQDQLERFCFPNPEDTTNVIINSFANEFCLAPYFEETMGEYNVLATALFDSLEQLWLAYYMKKFFNMKWERNGWKEMPGSLSPSVAPAREKEYYIVSWKHGLAEGNLLFWRANDAGYTTRLDMAGRYPESAVKDKPWYYNNGTDSSAILCEDLERMTENYTVVPGDMNNTDVIKKYAFR